MSEESYGKGEGREQQERRIRENVTSEEYTTALDRLRAFATDETAAELNKINTLDGLAERTRYIGSALRAIIIAKGGFEPGIGTSWQAPEGVRTSWQPATYELSGTTETARVRLLLTEMLKDDDPFVIVQTLDAGEKPQGTAERDELLRSLHLPSQKMERQVLPVRTLCIPSQKVVTTPGHSMLDRFVSANERTGQGLMMYHPRQHPHDAHIQQQFARVMQQSVKDVLALNLPPPQDIPSGFYK